MIDTVVTRLHDLDKYSWVIKQLELDNNNGYTLKSATISNDDIKEVGKEGFKRWKNQFFRFFHLML